MIYYFLTTLEGHTVVDLKFVTAQKEKYKISVSIAITILHFYLHFRSLKVP